MLEKEYILKHKEIPVMTFKMDNDTYKLLGINEIFEDEMLPFGLKDRGNVAQYIIKLDNWIKGRGLADSRRDLNEIKNKFKAINKEELIIESYGLNLTDHYWLHKTEDNLFWKNINFFDNTFDKLTVGGIANPDIDENVSKPSPNFCVDGSIEKRWIIHDGERFLLKGSRFARMQEPFNEKIASDIMDFLGIDHVKYFLKRTVDKSIPYSECKCMVNKNTEYINAQFVMDCEEYTRKDPYEHYMNMCKKKGINNVKKYTDNMISIDFLIGNEDRHKGNFGIIRDAETLEWLDIAPIFDNGNCLFYDRENEDIINWGTDSLGKAFGSSNMLCLNEIHYPEWYNSNMGRIIIDIIYNCLRDNERLKKDRIDKILDITKNRIDIFEKVISKKT